MASSAGAGAERIVLSPADFELLDADASYEGLHVLLGGAARLDAATPLRSGRAATTRGASTRTGWSLGESTPVSRRRHRR